MARIERYGRRERVRAEEHESKRYRCYSKTPSATIYSSGHFGIDLNNSLEPIKNTGWSDKRCASVVIVSS